MVAATARLSTEVVPAVRLGGAHQWVVAAPIVSRGKISRQKYPTAHVGSTSGK